MKYKPLLNTKIKQEKKENERKKKLYKTDDNVVIVEKSNSFITFLKFIIINMIAIFKVILEIVIFILSVIGVVALLNASSREVLLNEFKTMIDTYLPFLF